MNLRDGYEAILMAVADAWRVPEKLTVSQWADRNRVLPSKASAEPGEWRTSRTPYLQEPMDALSDHHPCSEVVVMAASQGGKSEILNNWIGYSIDHAPGPMLVVQPTVETAEKYSKQRIEPMLDLSPSLRDKVPSARKRDSGNSTLLKEFPGGILILVGSNSSSGLASMPIKKLGLDEVDKFPESLGDEGSATKQAEQRTVTFPRSKQFTGSTPVRMPVDDDDIGGSIIWRKYQAGSRAKYHVPCPHCGNHQELKFEHLRWQKTVDEKGKTKHLPDTAVYMCQAAGCGLAIEEHHKPAMLANASTGGSAHWVHARPWITERLSYHFNALVTPIGLGRSWAKIAEEWLEACRDRSKLVTFWNLILGLPFDDNADRLSEQELEKHAEDYALRVVPAGYQVLTAAVDTQDDHLDFLVRAWGRNERSIVIDRVKIWENPEGDLAWLQLTQLRHQTFTNAAGVPLRISMTAVDTGGSHTQRVYKYCRETRHDGVIAVKGSSLKKQVVLGKPSKKDTKNTRGDLARAGLALWMVGTDTAKEALYARLSDWADVELPASRMVRLSKRLGADFFRELTAEVFDPRTGLWKKLRARNEAIDLMVYSHAAACHPAVRVDKLTGADWDYLEAQLEPQTPDLFSPAGAAAPGTEAAAPADTPAPAPVPAVHTSAPAEAAAPAGQPGDAGHSTGWLDDAHDNWLQD